MLLMRLLCSGLGFQERVRRRFGARKCYQGNSFPAKKLNGRRRERLIESPSSSDAKHGPIRGFSPYRPKITRHNVIGVEKY
jgi:hypothetical protein